jgi:hypothetical protein
MQSSQVIDLMSSSLVSDLNRGGVKAVRLAADATLPKNGWLVRGVFTEVDQGSRMLRAEVGFGVGATDLAVLVNVADLQKGKVEPFYKLETQTGSRKMPGGAPMAIVTKKPLCGRGEVRHVPARSAEEHSANRTDDCRPNYSPSPTIGLCWSRRDLKKVAQQFIVGSVSERDDRNIARRPILWQAATKLDRP